MEKRDFERNIYAIGTCIYMYRYGNFSFSWMVIWKITLSWLTCYETNETNETDEKNERMDYWTKAEIVLETNVGNTETSGG